MSWVHEVVKRHSEMESPQSFWFWSGLCTISAVVKDNIWLNRGDAYNLYPNIYCILHADSGLKKGPPINMAKRLVRIVNNTSIISGRSSIQGILKKLGTAKTGPGGHVSQKSVGFICSSELSSSIVEDNAALTILTDLYDRNYNADEWESLLKMDDFKLRDPTVSLLGGINDAHAEEFFGKKDIQGGFLARTFIIYEKEENTINSLMKRLSNPPNYEELASYLKELAALKGKFKDTFDEENNLTPVGKYYDDWYNEFKKDIKRMGIKDETGTLNRVGDSILKIAVLLSLAKSPKLEIDLDSMEEAIKCGQKLIGNIQSTTMGRKGLSPSSPLKALIIRELMSREDRRISRPMLMKKYWMHYQNVEELDGIMAAFHEAGTIKLEPQGPVMTYRMPDEIYLEYKHRLEGKMK